LRGKRIYSNNPLWIICCCGCLPLIALIKSCIVVGLVIIIDVVGVTFISIILLPHDIWYSYYTLYKTQMLGRNIKILGMILLIIPLLVWPAIAIICAVIGSTIFGFLNPFFQTMDEDTDLFCGGLIDSITDSLDHVRLYWDYHYHNVF
jgi:hypothetical protein